MTNTFIQNLELNKYPSTQHLEGSQLQHGDVGFKKSSKRNDPRMPYEKLRNRYIVVEEKLDGANAGTSFSEGGEQLLQSRGHYLAGGGRERQFGQFKRWAAAHEAVLLDALSDRYVMYGEWMAKKHSMFYDNLPHLFCEFDIYDRAQDCFLSTERRAELLSQAPVLAVPVLYAGIAPDSLNELLEFVRPSLSKTAQWKSRFEGTVLSQGLDLEKCWKQADKSDLAEGLYIKVEEDGKVVGRYKWVRGDFTQSIIDSDQHHSAQPYIPNLLNPAVDIYAPELSMNWSDLGLNTVVRG